MRVQSEFIDEADELRATATIPLRSTADAEEYRPGDRIGPLRIVSLQLSYDLDAGMLTSEYPLEVEISLLGGFRYGRDAEPGDLSALLGEAYEALDALPNASYELSFARRKAKIDRVVG